MTGSFIKKRFIKSWFQTNPPCFVIFCHCYSSSVTVTEHSLFEVERQGQDTEPGNLAGAEIAPVTLGTVTFISAEGMGTVPVWKFVDV